MDIKKQLKKVTKELLSEEALNEIQASFEKAVEEKAKLNVASALVKQDEDYANKLSHLLEMIDKDHTGKLKKVVKAIDQNHASKLKNIVEKYNTALVNEAGNFKKGIINDVSTYLDAYIDEALPKAQINEALKNKKAQIVLEQIKEFLGVDTAIAKKAVKSAIIDGKRQIDEATKKLEAVQNEHKVLMEKYNSVAADLILEKKITSLSDKKKNYISRIMKGKSAEFIKENFDYALNLFDKNENERLHELKESAIKQSVSTEVDVPNIIEEKTSTVEEGVQMNPYLQELSKY
jgi:Ca2+-binding EF-hand superfamily protein